MCVEFIHFGMRLWRNHKAVNTFQMCCSVTVPELTGREGQISKKKREDHKKRRERLRNKYSITGHLLTECQPSYLIIYITCKGEIWSFYFGILQHELLWTKAVVPGRNRLQSILTHTGSCFIFMGEKKIPLRSSIFFQKSCPFNRKS